MLPINVGIAGLGRSGWNIHANLLSQLPELFQVKAVCDPQKSRRQEAESKFGCHCYTSLEAMLEDKEVELVVVATPSCFHSADTIKALKAGRHVVCEKPMALSVREADAMIAAAVAARRKLAVFHNRRYAPDFLKVKEVITSGKLGRILLIRMAWHSFSRRWDWQTLRKFGGGTLNNTGPHALDQALQLFGPQKPSLFCVMDRALSLGDADDHVKIVLKARNAPVIDLEISSACAYPQENWLVMGTRGGLHGTFSHLSWKYFLPEEAPVRKLSTAATPDRSYNADSLPWKPEESWAM
ncbi:MAG TPA: Gfo/Idh/MocA family oxidoreductase, partial [bacterium]|nr:Gfo/Idh/MocA family oxidoreductase [bacterium]